MSFSELFEIKFLVLLFFSVVSCFSSEAQINDPVGRLLTDIRVGGLLDSNDAEYRKVLTRLLAGSRYSSRLNINGPAAEGYINFYLIDPMAAYRVNIPANVATAKLFGNCGYLGANNAIACDSSVFSKFSKTINWLPKYLQLSQLKKLLPIANLLSLGCWGMN